MSCVSNVKFWRLFILCTLSRHSNFEHPNHPGSMKYITHNQFPGARVSLLPIVQLFMSKVVTEMNGDGGTITNFTGMSRPPNNLNYPNFTHLCEIT